MMTDVDAAIGTLHQFDRQLRGDEDWQAEITSKALCAAWDVVAAYRAKCEAYDDLMMRYENLDAANEANAGDAEYQQREREKLTAEVERLTARVAELEAEVERLREECDRWRKVTTRMEIQGM